MNPIDLEKTRIFEKHAREAFSASGPARPSGQTSPGSPASPPKVKQLSKEEKALLASGGVLSLAFGTILVANLPEETPDIEAAPAGTTSNLEVPTLLLETEPTSAAETHYVPEEQPVASTSRSSDTTSPRKSSPPDTSKKETDETLAVVVDVPEKIDVSTQVNDDMSFEEALKIARTDVGPGGMFVWKDTYYSTYSEQEWSRLSESQKEEWIGHAEEIIDPIVPDPEPPAQEEYLATAMRGEISWTGVDKNGDGQAEVLIAQSDQHPPVVMMDADGDGLLDTRYDLDPASGLVYASSMEQTSFTLAEVQNIPEMSPDQVFVSGDIAQAGKTGEHPVLIAEQEGGFIIAMDLDDDALVDVISLKENGGSPYVAMDMDSDGQIETSFIFDQDSFLAIEQAPMEPLLLGDTEEDSEGLYGYEEPNGALGLEGEQSVEEETDSEELHALGDTEDPYFDNQSDLADDFIGLT